MPARLASSQRKSDQVAAHRKVPDRKAPNRVARNRRGRLIIFSAALFLILAVTTGWTLREEAPVPELLDARVLWNAARERAGIWAADLDVAAALLDSSQASLDEQFARFPVFRQYRATRALIAAARDATIDGERRAGERERSYRDGLASRLGEVSRSLVGARTLMERMQADQKALNALSSAGAHLSAIAGLMESERPEDLERMMAQAESDVVRSTGYLTGRLGQFLSRRTAWAEWSRDLLQISRGSESPAVLVDKLNRTCFVFKRGVVCDSFPIEMGPNWMSRKLYSGDRATPEGRYKVVRLKTGSETIYYKAALIDYPNEDDRGRYNRGRRSGLVPEGAGIGSLIEIHGKGGRGSDWTLGCVGLENPDMDRLMPYLRVGTPVYIVGYWREPAWLALWERDGPDAASAR